jgi:pentatricopeptide repeat protein
VDVVLQRMRAAGKAPNTVLYNALMAVAAKHGEWARAARTLEAMRAAGVKPNVATFNSLVAAFALGEQWERAVRLARGFGV